MGMAIDEGWHQYPTLCLDNLVWLGFGSRLAGGEKGGNASIFNQHISALQRAKC